VRGVRDRTGRERFREPDAVLRQMVECGRFNIVVAIAMDVVGAERVYGDKKDVRGWSLIPLSWPR
jgi:hypothetical protein